MLAYGRITTYVTGGQIQETPTPVKANPEKWQTYYTPDKPCGDFTCLECPFHGCWKYDRRLIAAVLKHWKR